MAARAFMFYLPRARADSSWGCEVCGGNSSPDSSFCSAGAFVRTQKANAACVKTGGSSVAPQARSNTRGPVVKARLQWRGAAARGQRRAGQKDHKLIKS